VDMEPNVEQTTTDAIVVVRDFEPSPTHIRAARELVAEVLAGHHWPPEAIEKARVVMSELASNAVLHAQTPFQVRCRIDGDAVIEVTDWQPNSVPLVADSDPTTDGGLGLRLIEAIASEWGVLAEPQFKVVWCRLPGPDKPATPI
jgi:anti-sigma regulatory factor (Ser/Thr protein kinase)